MQRRWQEETEERREVKEDPFIIIIDGEVHWCYPCGSDVLIPDMYKYC